MGGDWDRLFEREFRRRLTGERERDLSFLPPVSPRAGERDRDRRRAGDLDRLRDRSGERERERDFRLSRRYARRGGDRDLLRERGMVTCTCLAVVTPAN